MKRRYYVLLFLLFTAFQAKSQDINALLKELKTSKEDTNKVTLLVKIGYYYELNNPDSAFYFYSESGKLSHKLNYLRGIYRYYYNYTAVLNLRIKFEESLKLNKECLTLAQQNHSKLDEAMSYGNLGASFYGLRQLDSCVNSFLNASFILEELKDSSRLNIVYMNLSATYSEMDEQVRKGITYGLKALALSRRLNDSINIQGSLNNIAGNLMSIDRYDSALVLLNQAYDLSKITNNKQGQISALTNFCMIYRHQGELIKMKNYAEELMKVSLDYGSDEGLANSYLYLGKAFFEQKQFSKAKEYAEKNLKIALELNMRRLITKGYQFLSEISLATGDLPKFHDYLASSDSVDDLILSDKIQQNIQDDEAKYSLNKKQSQINELEKEQEIRDLKLHQREIINWVLCVSILLFIVIGFLYYRNTKQTKELLNVEAKLQQQKIIELQTEKQLLATQSVLQGQEEERIRLAKDLHDGLGSILSGAKYSFTTMKNNLIISPENALAFDRSIALLDKSIQELRMIAHNMMPESLVKFGLDTALRDFILTVNQNSAIQISYQSFELKDDTLSASQSSAIYRIIQELVNNILKHADAKTALVQLIKKENSLSITVEDDGRGFDKASLKNNSGMGYLNLENRVTFIHGIMDVQSTVGNGTSVNIEITNIVND